MRKSNLERLREQKRKDMEPVQLNEDGLLELLVAPNAKADKRKLNPTQRKFIMETARVAAYMGAAGVAKTSTLCAGGWARALTMPDTQLLVGRNDYNKLLLTTGKVMESMLNALPNGTLLDRSKEPPMQWWIKPIATLENQNPEPSCITFMGLKDNMGSFVFSDAIIDEADDCEESRVLEVNTRLRHIRNWMTPEDAGGLFSLRMAFNPPDTTHWLYTAATGKDFQERSVKTPWIDKVYTPIPNENSANLPAGYHEELAKKLPEDMRMRLIEGRWGAVFPGQPVFRQFKRNVHCKSDLSYTRDSAILRFWDFGYNHPYVCWAQLDWEGRLLALHEFKGEKLEATAFARLVKQKSKEYFPDIRQFRDFGDPAVSQHKDTGKTLYLLSQEGIRMYYQKSEIRPGLDLIRRRLELMIDGEPALQFDNEGVPLLIRAMQGGYHMDPKNPTVPKKDGFYDHPADAYRYGCINVLDDGGMSRTDTEDLPDSVAYREE
jgi:hypothetical protein